MKPGSLVKRITGSRIDQIGIVLAVVFKDEGVVNPEDHCSIMWSSGEIFWHEIKWITII